MGFLGKRRDKSSTLTFCDLDAYYTPHVQIVSQIIDGDEHNTSAACHADLRSIPSYSPVICTGKLVPRPRRIQDALEFGDHKGVEPKYPMDNLWDLKLRQIRPLNQFPKDIVVSKGQIWAAKQRHLAMRFDRLLRDRIRFRDFLTATAREQLRIHRFEEIETPMLFKSTPEGAREFLVPTRRPGYAYALPQSPQQYKQLLMAGGFRQYFQFARCFRDEDLRADRQPEFTQLDIEMSFATGADVRRAVENLIRALFRRLRHKFGTTNVAGGVRHPTIANPEQLKEAEAALKEDPKNPPP
ncbi:hypothetical protein PG999_010496 [Apiospora kogelbergensis]|uniref:Aminoacyl-transfer RNA synthetases class-II family profile domain-containing protein n=1 Tax=Apiospora kogelbergensis TaxID=1337665 RepID=A0AAW0QHZ5_9PEZI